jgi:TrmH family RNA methyltransferase
MADLDRGDEHPRLTSLQNPRIQRARRLHRRSARDKERAFIVEGPNAVGEALDSEIEVQEIFLDPAAGCAPAIRDSASAKGVPLFEVAPGPLAAMTEATTPQGVLAIASMNDVELDELPNAPSLVLVLAEVRDPGNAGTLLRSAAAAGADAVIFVGGSVDPYGPKTIRASAGAALSTCLIRSVAVADVFDALRNRGVAVLAAGMEGSTAIDETDCRRPIALVVGNEAWGLPPEVLQAADETVSIPMPGRTESLNAAMAGSIMLFEALRQRREHLRKAPRILSNDG